MTEWARSACCLFQENDPTKNLEQPNMKFRLQIVEILLISPNRPHHMVLVGSLLEGEIGIGDSIYLPTNSGEDVHAFALDFENFYKQADKVLANEAAPRIGIMLRPIFDPAIVQLGVVIEGDGKARTQVSVDRRLFRG